MVWPTVIGAGASLLGGILSKPKTRSARDETRGGIMGQAQGAREAAEKYGFNPLTLLASSSPMGSQTGQNYMGAAIADAGMIVAEAMAKRADAGINSQLEAENARLKQQIQQQTLRPKVGGVYARRETIPTVGGRNDAQVDRVVFRGNGDSGADASGGGASGLRPLSETDHFDPRREVDNADIKSSAGFMVVDNPHIPFKLYAPTLDGDEPLNWYDYPSLIAPVAIGLGVESYKLGQRVRRSEQQRRQSRTLPAYPDRMPRPFNDSWEAERLRRLGR